MIHSYMSIIPITFAIFTLSKGCTVCIYSIYLFILGVCICIFSYINLYLNKYIFFKLFINIINVGTFFFIGFYEIHYYLYVFYINLMYSLNNLHKTLVKSVLFRLLIMLLVSLFSIYGIDSYGISLFVCILVLLSFISSKNKILFLINIFFIIIF